MKKQNNEPAFPKQWDIYSHDGMSLLDYFAAKAMQAMLSNPYVDPNAGPLCNGSYQDIAKDSYEQAKYMMEEREKYRK